MTLSRHFTRAPIALLFATLLVFTGCDLFGHDDDDHDPHRDMERIAIESLAEGQAGQTVAEWTHDDGWDQDALPTIHMHGVHDDEAQAANVEDEHGHENGEHAAWRVRIFDSDGNEINLVEGGEHEARYQPTDTEQHVIHYSADGHVHMNGEEGELFHGDHVHVYPREEGSTDIQFVLWHDGHSDGETDPITVVVEEEDDHDH